MFLMGKLDDLRNAGVPALDPRVEQIANDDSLTIEDRTQRLVEMLPELGKSDQLHVESMLERLAMQRLAKLGEETP